jgi:hypothetical protein
MQFAIPLNNEHTGIHLAVMLDEVQQLLASPRVATYFKYVPKEEGDLIRQEEALFIALDIARNYLELQADTAKGLCLQDLPEAIMAEAVPLIQNIPDGLHQMTIRKRT